MSERREEGPRLGDRFWLPWTDEADEDRWEVWEVSGLMALEGERFFFAHAVRATNCTGRFDCSDWEDMQREEPT